MKLEPAQPEEKVRNRASFVKLFATVFYFQLIGHVLWKYLGVSPPLALAISAAVFPPAYWVPPKPEMSFPGFVTLLSALVGAIAIELSIPDLLREHMPIQLAVSLPLLVLCIPLYYCLLKLAPDIGRKVGLLKFALFFVILAIVLEGAATILPESR